MLNLIPLYIYSYNRINHENENALTQYKQNSPSKLMRAKEITIPTPPLSPGSTVPYAYDPGGAEVDRTIPHALLAQASA